MLAWVRLSFILVVLDDLLDFCTDHGCVCVCVHLLLVTCEAHKIVVAIVVVAVVTGVDARSA